MRDLIRQILQGYKSLKLEAQEEGFVQFSGQEPDSSQSVSIKILPKLIGSDPQIAKRFNDLSRSIRYLNHPNIATVRKAGDEAGLPYIITRALEQGHSLAAKLDQPWAVDAAADIVSQVGLALEHAYNKGVVHGGLTPESISIQDNGRVLVADFGLDEMMQLVGAGAQKGASPYVAPERVLGRPADARADVYSLAAILYGMLTKRKPQVVSGQMLPPSRFNPDVSKRMDEVVVRALAADPADRYPDVKTFLTALGASTVVPAKKPEQVASEDSCPQCGAENQTGRFCRKCGARLVEPRKTGRSPLPVQESALEEAVLDEPIQVTKVDIGRVHVGKGVESSETVIAQPTAVAGPDLDVEFPEPLDMPHLEVHKWAATEQGPAIEMPEPPPIPDVDWAEIAPAMPEVPKIEDDPASEASD
ncbi:MAG: protein kinase [Anaerolineae bacterium]|jgi:serine/threonine-protein kinase